MNPEHHWTALSDPTRWWCPWCGKINTTPCPPSRPCTRTRLHQYGYQLANRTIKQ